MGCYTTFAPQAARGPERKDDWQVMDSLFYILRKGAPW